MDVKPYIVHQTFQFGGTKGKKHRLREAMLWYDQAAYYSDGKFIHAELSYLPAPADFESWPEFNMSMFHLQSMEHQLLQV
jgi:arabinosyltransferase